MTCDLGGDLAPFSGAQGEGGWPAGARCLSVTWEGVMANILSGKHQQPWLTAGGAPRRIQRTRDNTHRLPAWNRPLRAWAHVQAARVEQAALCLGSRESAKAAAWSGACCVMGHSAPVLRPSQVTLTWVWSHQRWVIASSFPCKGKLPAPSPLRSLGRLAGWSRLGSG